jgi:hypothetical protein
MANNRIHGTVPNANAGEVNLRLRCSDSYNQINYQDFRVYFRSNTAPAQHVADLTPHTVVAGEGASTTHIIPTSK